MLYYLYGITASSSVHTEGINNSITERKEVVTHMSLRQKQWLYWALTATLLAALVYGLWPRPMTLAVSTSPGPHGSYAVVAPSLEASSAAASPDIVTVKAISVPSSAPTELRIPSVGLTLRVLPDVCPVDENGDIHPATLGDACYYTADSKPYQLPGSETTDLSVIAGHTCRWCGEAAFNPVYDWQAQKFLVAVGDELWLKTAASGERWLVYRATATHTAAKGAGSGSLRESVEVWGSAPKPRTLITLGCLQPNDGSPSSRENIAIEWLFEDIRSL